MRCNERAAIALAHIKSYILRQYTRFNSSRTIDSSARIAAFRKIERNRSEPRKQYFPRLLFHPRFFLSPISPSSLSLSLLLSLSHDLSASFLFCLPQSLSFSLTSRHSLATTSALNFSNFHAMRFNYGSEWDTVCNVCVTILSSVCGDDVTPLWRINEGISKRVQRYARVVRNAQILKFNVFCLTYFGKYGCVDSLK